MLALAVPDMLQPAAALHATRAASLIEDDSTEADTSKYTACHRYLPLHEQICATQLTETQSIFTVTDIAKSRLCHVACPAPLIEQVNLLMWGCTR